MYELLDAHADTAYLAAELSSIHLGGAPRLSPGAATKGQGDPGTCLRRGDDLTVSVVGSIAFDAVKTPFGER